MLQVKNLTFGYRKSSPQIFNNFSLNLEPGRVCGLLGRNGAGKSTLMYLMTGLLSPVEGSVVFCGKDMRKRLPEQLADIFIVPEEFELPSISLRKYAEVYGAFYPRFSMDDMMRYLKVFEMNDLDVNLKALSMGQKKKVFMSFAFATNTRVLLMDEPTNGLDIPGKSTFRKVISMAASDDRTIIISTHQVRDIDKLLDHIIVMFNHKLLLNEPISEISRRLAFVESNDAELVEKALYCQSSVAGKSLVLPNDNDDDSEVNLETLFNLAIEKPEVITQLFNHKNA